MPPDERARQYDAEFYSETYDRLWARAAEVQLRASFQAVSSPGAAVDQIECRSSLCRVTARFPSQTEYNHAFRSLFLAEGDSGVPHAGVEAPEIDVDDKGAYVVLLYIRRTP